MVCLHCGDCCLRMSPLGSPCPKLIQHGTFYFCGDYEHRPAECMRHRHPVGVCPIGAAELGIADDPMRIQRRIDTGYAMLKFDMDDPDLAYNELVNQWG